MPVDLRIRVKDDGTPAVKRFSKTVKSETRKAGRSVDSLSNKLGRGLKSQFLALAPAIGAVGLVAFVKHTIDAADQVGKLSLRLGETTEFLSEMRFVAERSGVDVGALNIAIQTANKNIAEFAITGKGRGAQAFEALGLSLRDANGSIRSFENLLPEIAIKFSELGSEAEKTSVAFRLFGMQGVSMLQILKAGGKGIEELRQKARELGQSLSFDLTQKAADANDAMTNFSSALSGLGNEAIPAVLPTLTRLTDGLTETISVMKERGFLQTIKDFVVIQAGLKTGNFQAIADVTKDITASTNEAAESSKNYADAIQQLNSLFQKSQKTETPINPKTIGRSAIAMKPLNARFFELQDSISKTFEYWRGFADDVGINQDRLLASVGLMKQMPQQMAATAESTQEASFNMNNFANLAAIALSHINAAGKSLTKMNLSDFLNIAFGTALAIPGAQPFAAVGLGLKKLIGFQHGGQFQVRGSGGTDSQVVAFRATPGEQVTVTRPGQTTVNSPINVNISANRVDEFSIRTMLIPAINRAVQDNMVRLRANDLVEFDQAK